MSNFTEQSGTWPDFSPKVEYGTIRPNEIIRIFLIIVWKWRVTWISAASCRIGLNSKRFVKFTLSVLCDSLLTLCVYKDGGAQRARANQGNKCLNHPRCCGKSIFWQQRNGNCIQKYKFPLFHDRMQTNKILDDVIFQLHSRLTVLGGCLLHAHKNPTWPPP